MICETVEELTPIIGTRPACRALGAAPATVYRRRRPVKPKPRRPRPTPTRALSEPEREAVLGVLHSERFVDVSPEEVFATLLDEGTYLASTRTMYRLLVAEHGGVRERRDQLAHPAYAKPELLASGVGLMTPAAVHHGTAPALHQQRARVLDAAYARHPERFVRRAPVPPALPTAAWINKPDTKEVAAQ